MQKRVKLPSDRISNKVIYKLCNTKAQLQV